MQTIRTTAFIVASLLTTAAWAQSAGQPPLNLKLPSDVPAASASTAPAAAKAASDSTGTATPPAPPAASAAATGAYSKDPPGTYYGDTSGAPGKSAQPAQGAVTCDDATYNQPQVHGEVSTGVVSSSHHGSGNWQSGGVTLSQAFGSCGHPSGGMSISVGGSTGHFGH
ncbi:hypothetical protein ACXU4B_00450 [Dyella soli]|uniref:Uncharacterized protein n=1 Tax=Dyella soli TaxID=522319 RepID=A0A4V2NLK7_9GAMM|nr:hypothetical protein [Dyella soli]TCI09551.1 hypothetical protein EZM97_11320 [Dyella soli]